MRGLICDSCGNQINDYDNTEYGWTHIDLGTKLLGHRDYQDLCPSCTVILIDKLDEIRKLRLQ